MPAMAFMRSEYTDKQKIVSRALEFIAARAQEDGGIYVPPSGGYGGGLEVYNTAVSMTALYASGNQSYLPVIRKARDFIAASQHYGDDIYKGGFGYREEGMEEYVHGLNTFYSMQAMALTESIDTETTNEDGRARIDWGGTVDYFQLRQDNAVSILPEAPQLAYSPGPAEKSLEEDRFFHSYGSMTYVGLLALVYADIDRSDVRVRSAFDWAREHWTLEENPGRGEEGVFFFYYVLTRALSAYGVDLIQTSRGEFLNWRAEVAERVISLQRYDPDGRGYWVNDTARFWEDDPVLCTSYANLTLQMLLSPGMPR
jgi:squalene-hopene/tetraprenyl-beta-curcumene cyclase